MKAKVLEAKAAAIGHINLNCDGSLVDSPTSTGGSTNTGPVAIRFFSQQNCDALCSLIKNRVERNNYAIFLSQISVCLAVSESVDNKKIVNIEKFRQHCYDTMIHLALHFPWVKISLSVHQMLAHNWRLFQIMEGKPIAIWSENGLESWNKHIRNFRSDAGCRLHQTSVSANIHDIFVRMLITSAPAIAHARRNVSKRKVQPCETVHVPNQEEAIIQDIFNEL